MKISDKIEYSLSAEYGAVIVCGDYEMGDHLDDFLVEYENIIPISERIEEKWIFYIADISSIERIISMLLRFTEWYDQDI